MRVLLLQAPPHRNLADSVARALEVYPGVDLVCLPELCHTRYADLGEGSDAGGAEAADGLTRLSAQHPGPVLVAGVAWGESGGRCNALWAARAGRGEVVYRKTHLFRPMGEPDLFAAGRASGALRVATSTGEWALGLTICYDLRFPELYRQLADAGCAAVLVAAQWPAARAGAWRALLQARAAENAIWMLGVNRCGGDNGERFAGGSLVVDPAGEIVAEAGDVCRAVAADLDPDLQRRVRSFNDPMADRRFDLYPRGDGQPVGWSDWPFAAAVPPTEP